MKHREARRRFWSTLMARFEGSGRSRKDFAAEAGVGLAIFQYWLYKLRRERHAVATRKVRVADVRLVPVTVKARPAVAVRLELRIGVVRLRVPIGADPGYVARLDILGRIGTHPATALDDLLPHKWRPSS